MANYHLSFLHLLLLLVLLTTLTPITTNTTPTPSPTLTPTSTTITTLLQSPPSQQPPPTPPSHPPQDLQLHHHQQQQQLNNIIDALIGAGDFNSWANVLSVADPYIIPITATLFIPADDDPLSATATTTTTTTTMAIDPFIFPYHIIPQRLSFADLVKFKPFSRLPTLLPSKSILITNNSLSNFTLDDSLLSHPDLYTNGAFAVHGIATLLDYSVYGDADVKRPSQQEGGIVLPLPPPPSPSGLLFLPAGELIGQHRGSSNVASFCTEVWTVFLVVFVALVSKIHRMSLAY